MKKYILKRDLPLAKAGTIVRIKNGWLDKNLNVSFLYNFEDGKYPLGSVNEGELNEWLEEFTEKPASIWEVKEGDVYYDIYGFEQIYKEGCNDYQFEEDLEMGNAFLTFEASDKELQRRYTIHEIKKYCYENGIDRKFDSEIGNSYCFSLNNSGEVVFFDDFRNGNPIGYFSEENAQKILDNFEEELKIILE